jgi:hypothetical protein
MNDITETLEDTGDIAVQAAEEVTNAVDVAEVQQVNAEEQADTFDQIQEAHQDSISENNDQEASLLDEHQDEQIELTKEQAADAQTLVEEHNDAVASGDVNVDQVAAMRQEEQDLSEQHAAEFQDLIEDQHDHLEELVQTNNDEVADHIDQVQEVQTAQAEVQSAEIAVAIEGVVEASAVADAQVGTAVNDAVDVTTEETQNVEEVANAIDTLTGDLDSSLSVDNEGDNSLQSGVSNDEPVEQESNFLA